MSIPSVLDQLCQSQPDEVRWLLEEKYQWSRAEVVALLQAQDNTPSILAERFTDEVKADLEQLAQGVPVAYLIGWVTFLGCHIDLRYQTLIPRPETEFWVEKFIVSTQVRLETQVEKKLIRVLDLCCGSGCVGLSVLSHLASAQVDFADISEQALQQTQLNLELGQIDPARYRLIHTDLFGEIKNRYDIILCNPPYVDRFGYFSDHIRHEPEIALFAQNNGLALIEKIILEVKNYLNERGELWVEYGEGQAASVRRLAESAGMQVQIGKDQFDVDRYAIITTATSHPRS